MPVHAVIQKNDGELCQVLRERIIAYKKAHPRLSSQQIAKRFNMASSTLGRIENMDIKNPSLDQVVRILKGTGNLDELLEFLEKFYPEIADAYCSFYRKHLAEKTSEDLETYLLSKDCFAVLLTIISVPLNKEEICYYFGKKSLAKLDEMVPVGYVFFDEGTLKYSVRSERLHLSDKTTIELLVKCISEFSYDYTSSEPNRMLSFDTFSVNYELAGPKVANILRKARMEIHDVLASDKYDGSDALYLGLVSDVFFQSENN